MSSKGIKKTLLVGIGNPLRSDDGVGSFIVQKVNERHIPHLKTIVSQQLNIELLEEAREFNKVLLVDASLVGEGLTLRKVHPMEEGLMSSTHHLSAEFFLTLSKKLYPEEINLYLCSIRGKNFDLGEELSPEVKKIIPNAVEEICAFLTEK